MTQSATRDHSNHENAAPSEPDRRRTGTALAWLASAPIEALSWLRAHRGIRRWALALFLVAVAGVLNLRILTRQTLWADELFSLAIATGHSIEHAAAEANASVGDFVEARGPTPLDELRRYVGHEQTPASPARVIRAAFLSDTNPPLYYLLLSAWTRLMGTTDGDLRSFSVGWFLACIPFILALARRIAGPGSQVSAGLLFILSPLAVYYATEGRMYSLFWFWVVSSAWLTLRLREQSHNRLFETLWVFTSAAGLLTHYFFVFPWSAMVAFLWLRRTRGATVRIALRVGVIAVLVFPWYRHVPATLAHWRVTHDWLTMVPHEFNRARASLGMGLQFFSNDGHYLWWEHPAAEKVLWATFSVLAIAMVLRLRRELWSGDRLLLWLWFGASWAGPVVFDALRGTFTVAVPRYAISALPAAALISALALTCFKRPARFLLLGVVVCAWSFTLRSIYDNPSRNDQPFWKIGQILSAETTGTDLILIHSVPTGAIGVARYTQSSAPVATWVGQLGTRTVPESIVAFASGFRRIFFVRVHEVGEPAPEEDWLRQNARVERDEKYGNAVLVVFSPATAERF